MSGSSWILQPPDHDVQLAPSWVSSFKTRNTFQILYSCIFTLILSAWTMLHPGIPSHAQRNAKWSGAKLLGQRLQLALVGLLLPEFMLLMAFLEYIRARQTRALFKELEERYPRPTHTCSSQGIQMDPKPKGAENTTGSDTEAGSGSKNSQNISRWKRLFQFFYPDKLERGYYACMGGFELHGDTAANPNDVFTLPPNVVAVLIALGITPEISSEEINDKSKAERFTKLIACLQALWMVIQVLTRKAVGLPITLLEFNAVMHIVCALVAYLAWFRKPKDINIPTPIKQGDAMGLSWQLRYLLVGVRDVHDTSKESFPPKFQRPNIILQYTRDEEGKLGGGQWRLSNAAINDTKDIWKPTEILGNELTPWQIGGISIVKSPSDQVSAETKPLIAVAQDEKPAVSTTESTVHTDAKNQVTEAISTLVDTVPASLPQEKIRTQEILIRFGNDMPVTYEWAQFVVNFCLDENQRVGPTQLTWANYCEVTKKSTVLAQPMGDWGWLFSPTEDNMERAIQNPMTIYSGVTWIFLSAVYGAIHLVPWNSYFPTLLERYMWRFSGITTICGAPVFFIISLLAIKLTKHSSTVPKIAFPSQLANLFNGNNLDGAAKFFFSLFLLLCLPVIIAWAFAFCIFFCVVAFGTIISLFGIGFLSLCARLYMIAEGFASLRSLPHAAYDNINWLDIYPHF